MTATVVPVVLDRENYDDWSSRIHIYLLAEDLWDVVDGTYESPIGEDGKIDDKAWGKKNAKALYAIQSSCRGDTYQIIKDKTTASEAWYTLLTTLKPDEPPDEKETRSVLEAYPTQTHDDDATPQSAMEEGHTGGHDHESNANDIHKTFANYVKHNDWDNAIKILRQYPQEGKARLPFVRHGTALHYASKNFMSCSVHIIQQLVDLTATEDLEITDDFGYTALYCIINYCPDRVQAAECMVKKNNNLLTILPRWVEGPLVVVAQERTKGGALARYFYSLTPHQTLKVSDAAQLISDGFYHNRFDIAWDLIQRYPKLAMAIDRNMNIPLVTLANNRFAFFSGSQLNLWKKLIYYVIRIKRLPPINKDSHINVEKHKSGQSDQGHLSDQKENRGHPIFAGMAMGLFPRLVSNLQTLLGINRIYQMKLVHEWVAQFLPLMFKASERDMSKYQRMKLNTALCVAAERGHMEYITHFLRNSSYPVNLVTNKKGQNLLQIAAECRHHKVYNLIHVSNQLRKKENIPGLDHADEIRARVRTRDQFGNNLLHTVASITPLSQINHIQGAALQMQRELQWFKEVESIVHPKDCESVNKDKKTPRKVFTENHKELGKEAEKSMKETATSCTVVGALIVTIMFAAAFIVPGENDEKAGRRTFLTNSVLTTFIVSDAISLFSSTTSVIMFLGILTSRYSEDDFYKSLPTKMIIGLFTLFLSIATMMIVFSSGLYIMLEGKSSIVIPSILLASVPVTSFILMQFPLFVELFINTFGPGIFDRKQKNLF
ncbi:uncharacterized protein LOC108866593 isoform X3 [Pyrus x bretschneideri]|nr:uncharacterized protein LOC108866593 isoform X3 [Pyrus x bretschneideri]